MRVASHDHMPPMHVASGTRRRFAKANACAGSTGPPTSLLLLGLAHEGLPDGMPSDQFYAAVNVLLLLAIHSASPAVISGLIFQSSQYAWPLWGIALAFLSMYLALIFLIVGVAVALSYPEASMLRTLRLRCAISVSPVTAATSGNRARCTCSRTSIIAAG